MCAFGTVVSCKEILTDCQVVSLECARVRGLDSAFPIEGLVDRVRVKASNYQLYQQPELTRPLSAKVLMLFYFFRLALIK